MQGLLYLVPNTLGNSDTTDTIPSGIKQKVNAINFFIVENLRNARRYLKNLNSSIDIDQLTFYELNEHTNQHDIPFFLQHARSGADTALLSEAGVPGVADPGAVVVRMAHELGIRVVPLTGPSSILLSLMSSGLNGQSFRFLGYLPVKQPERIKKIRNLDQTVRRTGVTQIFIETPYRNDRMIIDLLNTCHPTTLLCIAVDITQDSEFIHTKSVMDWKKRKPSLHKRPAIFLLGI